MPHFSADAKALYAEVSALGVPDGTEAVVLDDEDSFTFDADGNSTHTEYVVYKVLSQSGVDGWSGVSKGWEPWHEDRPVVRARVIKPDLTVYELDAKTVTDTPAAQESADIYSDRRVLRAPLPAMAPGSVVEEELVSRGRALFPGAGSAARIYFGRTVPVQHTRLSVEAPASLPLRYKTQLLPNLQPQLSESGGNRRLILEAGPTPSLDPVDGHLPADVPDYPMVQLTTAASWQDIAGQYAGIVDGRIAAADVRALVGGLVQGKQERPDKIQAILDFLNREVRYTGVEFGESAIIPRSPSETLSSKYGDCKDKATLLVAMLRAADIPAHLALLSVGTTEDVLADLPTADFFDHAIVYVPGDKPLWIDATAQYSRPGELPGADQNRSALVVRAGSGELLSTPQASSQDNLLLEEREIDLAEYGPARVVETSHPRGIFESWYRDVYTDDKNKETLKNLTQYMQSQYLAESMDRMERSDPRNLGSQFQLQIESKRAKRGITELDSAVAVIRLEGLFYLLPKDLKETAAKADSSGGKPPPKRTADYQLHMPFTVEWQYRIVPTPGFRAAALPQDASLPLGPANLAETFTADGDGVVHATLRFDTAKRRYTVAEMEEMRDKIVALLGSEPILIRFRPLGQLLLEQGKASEAFRSYRDVIAQQPERAMPHLRMAKALLAAGFGEPARAQARLAVKLDPQSGLAQSTLGDILESDLVGRKWRSGSDLAGAAAAFRAAQSLDSANKDYHLNLALALERNAEGVRYGSGSDLLGATAEYRKLTAAELTDQGFQANPAFTLFYAGQFAEAQAYLESINPRPEALAVACQAVLKGLPAALAEAGRQSADDEHVKHNLLLAGDMLEKVRQYAIAADLMQAGASGDNAAHVMALASMLRGVRKHEEIHSGDTPDGVVVQLFSTILDSGESLDGLMSRNEKALQDTAVKAGPDLGSVSIRQVRAALTKTGGSPDVVLDLLPQLAPIKSEGSDAAGYRETLQVPGSNAITFFVVREKGRYRVLTADDELAPLGLEALDRIADGNPAAARTLLDWARDQQHLGGGDDPLSGEAFPRLWNKGQDADGARMTLAAAALLVQNERAASRGLKILESVDAKTLGPMDQISIDLALLTGYENLQDYEHSLAVAARLAQSNPESESVFKAQSLALRVLKRFDEADVLAQRRLVRIPGDVAATRALAFSAVAREDYKAAFDALHQLADAAKARATDYNQLAWYSLYFDRPGGPDVDSATEASQLAQSNPSFLHTLATVYAEMGKAKEAHDVIIHAMDLMNLSEPNGDFWYVFGRLAEQYGELEIARDCYVRVTAPNAPWLIPASTYRLAQNRLKGLQTVTAAAGN